MNNPIFPLLRLGLNISTVEEEILSDFILMKSDRWRDIGDLARKHGVLGIMLDGVDKLQSTPYGPTRELKTEQKLEWIGEVLQIEKKNRQQMAVMEEMAGIWKEAGCRVMVMKGLANGKFYPNPEHRTPGDIDCYLFGSYKAGNSVAKKIGARVNEEWYKHSEIYYKGEMFENHQLFVHTRGGKRSKQLEKELESALNVDEKQYQYLTASTVMPPVQWVAMFLTYHACGHFLTEGLRLKQILDWAMFLKRHQQDVNWKEFYAFCERYHLRCFVDAVTAISCDYLGIRIIQPGVVAKSAYSEKILKSTLNDEDYIYSADGGGWKEKKHVVKNLFKYRWKYDEIYEESVWKQLWYYATGYLFKTEN